MNRPFAWLGAALVSLALASPAFAAGEITGRISGYVYDPTGAPLAEVPLTLTSTSLLRPQSRSSGEDGRFEFVGLPPGEDYVLEVNVPGFVPQRRAGITVRLGQTTPLDVRLTVLTETQSVETFQIVERVNPVLNPDSAAAVAVITAEKAAASPIFHQVEGIPQQVAGVGPGTRPSTRGGFARYGKFYVDGLDTTDITDGSITAPMNFDAVENFEVITGGLDAQYNALGMVENVVTKNGGDRFTYDVSAVLSPPSFTAKTSVPASQPSFNGAYVNNESAVPQTSFYSPVVNVGGPLIKGRLWFFVSGQLNRSARESVISTPYSAQEVRSTATRTDLARLKLTWQPTEKDRASFGFNFDHNHIDNSVGNGTVTDAAEQKVDRGGFFLIGNYDHSFTENLLFQLQTGMTHKNVDNDPQFDTELAAHTDIGPGVTQFNAAKVANADTQGNFLHEAKERYQFDPTLSWNLHGHQLKAGLQLSLQRSAQLTGITGTQRYFDRGGTCDPADPSSFAFCNQRADFYNSQGQLGPLKTNATVVTTGLFLQDRWTVGRKLTLVPGIRLDVGKLYGDGGAFITNLVGVGPRLSGIYDVLGDRKSLVTAHYGRSNDVGNISVAQHANAALTQVISTFNGSAFPGCSPNSSTPGCTTSGGAAGRSFASGQKPPYVDEVAVGYKQETSPETVVGVDLTYRHYGNEWADEETNRIFDASGTRIVGYANGVPQSIVRSEAAASAYRDYKGVDLWVQGTPGRWDLLASYTLAFTNGTVNDYFDGYLNNPRFTQFYDGYVSDDRRHTLKGTMTYRTSFGLDLGLRLQYRTGNALWESASNPADGSQRSYRSPRGTGYALNSTTGQQDFNDPTSVVELRNPSQFLLDAQARYDLGKGIGLKQTKLEIIGLLVNVLNSSEVTAVSDQYALKNSRYGLALSRQAPLQAELLLRVRN